MSKIIDAIKLGEDGVLKYIKENNISDSDILEINKYVKLIKSSKINEEIVRSDSDYVNKVVLGSVEINGVRNDVLVKSLSVFHKMKNKEKIKDVFLELEKRTLRNEFKFTKLLDLMEKYEDLEMFKLLDKTVVSEFGSMLWHKDRCGDLSKEENFDKFFRYQTSGLWKKSITSLRTFGDCLTLFDKRKEDIKTVFRYFDATIVEIADSVIKNENQRKELIKDYIEYYVSNNSCVYSFSNERTDYMMEIAKKDFKEKMKRAAKTLGLDECVKRLNKYEINEDILNGGFNGASIGEERTSSFKL